MIIRITSIWYLNFRKYVVVLVQDGGAYASAMLDMLHI